MRHGQLAAEPDLSHHLPRQRLERPALGLFQHARLAVDHAKGAQGQAGSVYNRHARVKPDMGIAGYQRVARKALIL